MRSRVNHPSPQPTSTLAVSERERTRTRGRESCISSSIHDQGGAGRGPVTGTGIREKERTERVRGPKRPPVRTLIPKKVSLSLAIARSHMPSLSPRCAPVLRMTGASLEHRGSGGCPPWMNVWGLANKSALVGYQHLLDRGFLLFLLLLHSRLQDSKDYKNGGHGK